MPPNINAGTILNQQLYQYNGGGHRGQQTRTDNGYTTCEYYDDAQLTSLMRYTEGGTPIAAEQLGFGYDGGWNLNYRSVNGTPTADTVNNFNLATGIGGLSASYDANGNRTSEVYDANDPKTYTYTGDDENQWLSVVTDTYHKPAASRWKSEFPYDGRGRLRVKKDYTGLSSGWVLQAETRYLYDGMRVVQERDGSNVLTVAYTRGLDLSGRLEGAGGIGGLLARSHGYSGGGWPTHSYYHADGGGNVTCLLNASQATVASYRYDPYGRTLGAGGPLASANTYRFSSKEIYPNSGLYYFGYRFYDPNTHWWVNRDPIGETGGLNPYAFVRNRPIEHYDPLGLFEDGHGGRCPPGGFRGHSDFYGHNCFDSTLEDHDPNTEPIRHPASHFQNLTQSESQVRQAIEQCDQAAFAHAMHRLQDYFSHYEKGYRWDPPLHCGHAFVASHPDRDNEAWTRANRATRMWVTRWLRACGSPNGEEPVDDVDQ